MRPFVFNMYFWIMSGIYAILATPMVFLPGRRAINKIIRAYTKSIVWGMRWIAGIRTRLIGQANLPDGAYILAAKHQSYGDGIVLYGAFRDLAFVTGDHLERFPLIGGLLKKLGAIVVNNCGGPEARRALSDAAALAHAEDRKILISPEGHLSAVGEKHRYRTGVYHMAKDFGLPVIPVATNLGLNWPQQKWEKHKGLATVEFLPPLDATLGKAAFMAALEGQIESRTQALVAEATGQPIQEASLVEPAAKLKKAA